MRPQPTKTSHILKNCSVDGLRIDSVLEVEPDFFPGYQEAAGVYCVGEVDNGNPALDCPYQDYLDGVLNYPMYIPLPPFFFFFFF